MDIIIELLIAERQKLAKRINDVDKKLSELGYSLHGMMQDAISDLPLVKNNSDNITKSNYVHFKKDGNIRDQALEVLKTENRFLFKKEIVDVLLPFHKSRGLEKLTTRVTSELSHSKTKIPSLITYQFSSSKADTVWGKSEWLDENGVPKPEYMYTINEDESQAKMFQF